MQEKPKQFTPEPAASFAIEFLNQRDVQDAMAQMGFRLIRSVVTKDEEEVHFEGESTSNDGTTIEITVKKGKKYKSPAELAKKRESE